MERTSIPELFTRRETSMQESLRIGFEKATLLYTTSIDQNCFNRSEIRASYPLRPIRPLRQ